MAGHPIVVLSEVGSLRLARKHPHMSVRVVPVTGNVWNPSLRADCRRCVPPPRDPIQSTPTQVWSRNRYNGTPLCPAAVVLRVGDGYRGFFAQGKWMCEIDVYIFSPVSKVKRYLQGAMTSKVKNPNRRSSPRLVSEGAKTTQKNWSSSFRRH